jgi:predicted dehydrogenase
VHNIAVVGAGQLGSRHLQGLCRLRHPATLYVVDPSKASRNRALERAREMPENANIRSIEPYENIESVDVPLSLAIVASPADVRFALVEALLARDDRPKLLLEKVLFQRPVEYQRTAALLRERNASAWVNLPRRMYNIYDRVRERLAAAQSISVDVAGGGWGLGCNGIHFADLFNHLTGAIIGRFETHHLDATVYGSKRPGYKEFGGTISGRSGTHTLRLHDSHERAERHLITIRSEAGSWVIDESEGRAYVLDERAGWEEWTFTLPYQSGLTSTVAEELLISGRSSLPTFDVAAAVHLPFIDALLTHYNAIGDAFADALPIT